MLWEDRSLDRGPKVQKLLARILITRLVTVVVNMLSGNGN